MSRQIAMPYTTPVAGLPKTESRGIRLQRNFGVKRINWIRRAVSTARTRKLGGL